ncbi:small secreted protein [Curvularia clavata]|uniref:Small secreted protein n=1 Tax=Curvularia clavata TaxID=95742 RepID=A0A9Q8ZEU7_CURCL|nr:small secreted protein [Curvularia clavata]
MYMKTLTILALGALSIAAPTPDKRGLVARAAVLKDTTYNAISISGGKAGNAKAEATAVFSALDLQNPENIDPADLTFLNNVNQVANDAEKSAFNTAVAAASGDEATQIQNGKIKNKVLKLMATVIKLQAQQAQGQDVAAKLADETKKLNNNIALDTKAAGQTSIAEPFDATISGSK